MRSMLLSLVFIVSLGTTALGAQAMPSPPGQNPYPPTSAQDKLRVETAVAAIDAVLRKVPAVEWLAKGVGSHAFVAKDLSCLKSAACWQADVAFAQNIRGMQSQMGQVSEIRFPHVMPWTMRNFEKNRALGEDMPSTGKLAPMAPARRRAPVAPQLLPDEYMVHVYARAAHGGWYHLDVIMTEDAQGKPAVRYFFATPMVSYSKLPPGVVC